MTQKYFDNIPDVIWNKTRVKNITRRAELVDSVSASPFVFHPYDIKHNLRADQIAELYYNDPYLDWLIYHSNDIIDPYYHWYLDDYQMEKFLIDKYGSVEYSQRLIKHFVNNWDSDPEGITVQQYNSSIAPSWKKYYTPVYGAGRSIISFARKQQDVFINTNRILEYSISANNNALALEEDELIDIKIEGGDSSTVGTGQVIRSNSSVVQIQHCFGNTSANGTHMKLIVGESSEANLTVNAVATVIENVTEEEEVFWSPVTYFDYEQEINEQKKVVKIADAGFKDILVQQFFEKLREGTDPLTNLVDES